MIRAMRIILMFDIPQVTSANRKTYRKWHKFLENTGFVMMTESVYSRLVLNRSSLAQIKTIVKKNLPPSGNIQMLEITEKQYCSIEYYLGEEKNKIINTLERYVEI